MSALALAPLGAPTSALRLLWLIPAMPAAGAAINLFAGKRLGRSAGVLSTALVAAAFALALVLVRDLVAVDAGSRLYVRHLFEWIHVGSFSVGADLRLDALSAVMILVVTGIGSLIHLYSIGYMQGDPRYGRFFAYLNLFVFFMLLLVLAEQLPPPLPGLGGRRALLVPADRLLVREDRQRERREEGVHHHADRRHRHADRARAASW